MEPKDAKHRILLVDDHPLIHTGVSQLIEEEGDLTVCAHAETAREALVAVKAAKPEVAIVDVSLAGLSGLELMSELQRHFPEIRVLVLSMHEESLYAERCLRVGAMGYVMKSEPPTRVIEGIRSLLAGKIFLSEAMKERLLNRLADKGRQIKSLVDPLSDREMEVFRAIGRGFTTGEIAKQLSVSPKTVQTYREHIKEKLNIRHAAELMQKAVQWIESERDA